VDVTSCYTYVFVGGVNSMATVKTQATSRCPGEGGERGPRPFTVA